MARKKKSRRTSYCLDNNLPVCICNTIVHLLMPGRVSHYPCPFSSVLCLTFETLQLPHQSPYKPRSSHKKNMIQGEFSKILSRIATSLLICQTRVLHPGWKIPVSPEIRFNALSVQCHKLSFGIVGKPVKIHHHFFPANIHVQPPISQSSPNAPLSWCLCPQGCKPASPCPIQPQPRQSVGMDCKGEGAACSRGAAARCSPRKLFHKRGSQLPASFPLQLLIPVKDTGGNQISSHEICWPQQ